MSKVLAAQWVSVPWYLSVPAIPDGSCSVRSRLTGELESAVQSHGLTVVAAPSGYGKSTLLAQWAPTSASTIAWFTVPHDPGDQLQMLIAGVMAAVTRHHDRFREARAASGSADAIHGQPSIETLGRVLLSVRSPLVIVIDDAHRLNEALADDMLQRIVSQSAGTISFVLSGHGSLVRTFAGPIASGRVALISSEALAFTEQEIQTVWQSADEELTEKEASSARELSGGWPIAIRAMRIALGASSDWRHAVSVSSVDEQLTAYIDHIVLAGLRTDLREFILAATTCSRLTSDLAREISSREDAAALLEECVDAGIFLTRRVDAEGAPVYFWHDLFARHCRAILTRSRPDLQRQLRMSAARALAPHDPLDAIRHALAAQDVDLAAQLIITWWPRIIIESGARELDFACSSLPAELRGGASDILWIRAVCRHVLGELASSSMLAARASALSSDGKTALIARLILEDDPVALARTADSVSDLLVELEGEDEAQHYRLFLLGWTELRLRRDPQRAAQLLQTVMRDADCAGAVDLRRRAQENLAFALAYGGRFSAALDTLDERSEPSRHEEWRQYDGGIRDFTLGFIRYWRGDTSAADEHFRTLLNGSTEGVAYTALAAMFHALCVAAFPDPTRVSDARARLQLLTHVRPAGVPWQAYHAVSMAALDSATGQSAELGDRLAILARFPHVPAALAVGAELLRSAGKLDQATSMLRAMRTGANSSYAAATALTTSALIAHQRGLHQLAHERFERALNIGVPEGVARPFIARNHVLIDLMNAHRARGTPHDAFLNDRIASSEADLRGPVTLDRELSDRQKQVYGYLCTALSVDEIAGALGVSVNTIRTHQRAIYRKLGVTSRREAVQLRFAS